MRLHLNTAWHSFLGIITSHEARDRSQGLLCAAHVANWLVSCHLVFLQIGKLSFSAGALELLSLLSRFPLNYWHHWWRSFVLFTLRTVYRTKMETNHFFVAYVFSHFGYWTQKKLNNPLSITWRFSNSSKRQCIRKCYICRFTERHQWVIDLFLFVS